MQFFEQFEAVAASDNADESRWLSNPNITTKENSRQQWAKIYSLKE